MDSPDFQSARWHSTLQYISIGRTASDISSICAGLLGFPSIKRSPKGKKFTMIFGDPQKLVVVIVVMLRSKRRGLVEAFFEFQF